MIPNEMRKELGLREGDDFLVLRFGDGDILLRPIRAGRQKGLFDALRALKGMKVEPEQGSDSRHQTLNYILDTNVVSEVLKASGRADVVAWVHDNQFQCFISAVTVGEIEKGIEQLPAGRKKRDLQTGFREFLPVYEDRVIAFDLSVARRWAKLAADLRRAGRQTSVLDSMIEATALQWSLLVVTRNASDFIWASTFNPWEPER